VTQRPRDLDATATPQRRDSMASRRQHDFEMTGAGNSVDGGPVATSMWMPCMSDIGVWLAEGVDVIGAPRGQRTRGRRAGGVNAGRDGGEG
jgi:hypothetical protein